MNQEFFKDLLTNSLFWTGGAAVALTALQGDFSLLIFLFALVAFNLALLFVLRQVSPRHAKQLEERRIPHARQGPAVGNVVFNLTPLRYPKVLDEEMREFAPEFIRLEVRQGRATLFAGDLARDAMKQLRDAISGVLTIKDTLAPPSHAVTPAAKTPSKKG